MDSLRDVRSLLGPMMAELRTSAPTVDLPVDPFDPRPAADTRAFPVASGGGGPTVNATRTSGPPGRQLTAILIADDRPVAVIDGAVVNVGDVLPDGGRVASIRSDRVSILEKNGQWKVLIIRSGRQ